MFEILLYISLVFCAVGTVFQIWRFRRTSRFLNALPYRFTGIKPIQVITGIFNSLIHFKLFNAGKIRWVIHFCVFAGFLYLLLVHGLHRVTADFFFGYYEPTIDPFQLLRNFFGLIVLAGCMAFMFRRRLGLRINTDSPLKYKGFFSIILIMLLMITGIFLEATKIISEPIFMDMVSEYSDIDESYGLDDLKIYWNKNFKVSFEYLPGEIVKGLENGAKLNEEYCLSCHSDTRSAFVSIQVAKLIYYGGTFLNRYRADIILYWIHYVLCLFILVCFPFFRLFHLALIPITSFKKKYDLENHWKGQAFVSASSLYACTNCGYCSEVCSVYPHVETTRNRYALPHLKIEAIKGLITGDTSADPWLLQKGNEACTMCYNCTSICPSGIDLQTLWSKLDETLERKGFMGSSYVFSNVPLLDWIAKAPVSLKKTGKDIFSTGLAGRAEAFENCIQCTVCTNVCPVVFYDGAKNDYTPQQVMNLLRLGQRHLAEGTRMVHTCLTCYACQEVCPQQIRVTDILLELRESGCRKAEEFKKTYFASEDGEV